MTLEEAILKIENLEREVSHWKQEFSYINSCEKGLYTLRRENEELKKKLREVRFDI